MRTTRILRNVAVISAAALTAGLVAGAPAQAASPAVDKCSAKTTNHSSSEKTRVIWKVCIGNSTGAHTRIHAECQVWSFLNGWYDTSCELRGNQVLRKNGTPLEDGPYGFQKTIYRGGSIRTEHFNCQGSGTYSVSFSDVVAYPGYPNEDYASAPMTDTSVSTPMC